MNNLLRKISGDIRFSGQLASMLYRGLDFRFSVENGRILTDPLLLDVRGAEMFSPTKLELGADLRVHWQKKGQPGPIYNLGDAVRWLRSLSSPPGSE